MLKLILLRHGQSLWNRDNRFTGWTDVGLTPEGEAEALAAARLMRRHDLTFDLCFSSCLRRAIKTLWLVLEEMELMWLPVDLSWRLNERHYGALQGLNKEEMAARVGEEQVRLWRRSYDVRPPALSPEDERWAGRDRRYAGLRQQEIPGTESLKDTVERVLPYWHGRIVPELKAGRRVLVCAHGNSLRGLVKYLEQIPDQEIPALEIPTGQPLLYELDAGLQVRRRYYLHEAGAAG